MAEGDAEPEPVRRPGEEWTSDGARYKMDRDGQVLREGFVKEQKEVEKSVRPFLSRYVHDLTFLTQPRRRSPSKLVFTVSKRWLTPDQYEKYDKEGKLTTEYDAEAIIVEMRKVCTVDRLIMDRH